MWKISLSASLRMWSTKVKRSLLLLLSTISWSLKFTWDGALIYTIWEWLILVWADKITMGKKKSRLPLIHAYIFTVYHVINDSILNLNQLRINLLNYIQYKCIQNFCCNYLNRFQIKILVGWKISFLFAVNLNRDNIEWIQR